MISTTNIDLEHLKKVLDIARDSGVHSMSLGEVSFTFKDGFRPAPVSLSDEREERLESLKDELKRLDSDADADTFWSV